MDDQVLSKYELKFAQMNEEERTDKHQDGRYLSQDTQCCNRSSLEIVRQNKWTTLRSLSNHIMNCGGTRTEDTAENANPNTHQE
jgi:hypothetical protein